MLEIEIEQLKNEIKLKPNMKDVQDLIDKRIKELSKDTINYIDNTNKKDGTLNIGGRNLLPKFTDKRWRVSQPQFIKDDYTIEIPSGNENILMIVLDLEPNTDYIYTHNTNYMRWHIQKVNDDGSTELIEYNSVGGYEVRPFNTRGHTKFKLTISTGGHYIEKDRFLKYLKLEKGNAPTDWSPDPEDFENDISNINNTQNFINKNEEYLLECLKNNIDIINKKLDEQKVIINTIKKQI